MRSLPVAITVALALAFADSLAAGPIAFNFSTGLPSNSIGLASRPASAGKIEIEAADDFITTFPVTVLTSGSFTGLLTGGATASDIAEVLVEIYRVFPKDSNTARTITVPTRVNSPSDVEFAGRDSAASGQLAFSTTVLSTNFTANNSILNGINPFPSQQTGGEGPISGQEVQFNLTFTTPFTLPADHYFFIPQVKMNNGEFFWLSAERPITTGTPFSPDLQSWIRNANLDPDWLRAGTDIVGSGSFNQAFTLAGTQDTPEPATLGLLAAGLIALGAVRKSKHNLSNR